MIDTKNYGLIIFDVDGTLVKDYSSDQLLPEAVKFFRQASVTKSLFDVALATNQSGVGLRYWMEKDGFGEPEKYPTRKQVQSRILFKVAGQMADLYCYPWIYIAWRYQSKKTGQWGPVPYDGDSGWSKEWRKPNPGMILEAMKDARSYPDKTLFVGDSDEDKEAAINANCHFVFASDFFNQK